MKIRTMALLGAIGLIGIGTAASAQAVGGPGLPWRGAGPAPCYGWDDGALQCETPPGVTAIRAGRMFDSIGGRMLTDQVIILDGERIRDVGPAARTPIPAGAQIVDLSRATVLPGLIDAHIHMFNRHRPGKVVTREAAALIAVQHLQSDLRAGFTTIRDMSSHDNGYGDIDVRDAIDRGEIDGPRAQVSTRGIVWDGTDNAHPGDPLGSNVISSIEEGRAAVREQVAHGADWIKLFPTGGYAFAANGDVKYVLPYPLPVLQALIDEAHKLGKKTACHVFGGVGQHNAVVAGCDTIEHGFSLNQAELAMMVAKGLAYDPTLGRYTEPYMDDTDAKNTGGKYRIIPIIETTMRRANATPGLRIMVGSGADGAAYVHGTQALDFEILVRQGGLTPLRALQGGTIVNAEVMGWQDRVGSIAKGKYADIVAVAGDPLADIAELQRMKFVMKGGKIIRNEIAAVTPGAPAAGK